MFLGRGREGERFRRRCGSRAARGFVGGREARAGRDLRDRRRARELVRVVRGDPWVHVLLPERPNGSTGWLRAARIDTSIVRDRIIVRLRKHTLTRYHEGRPIGRYRVAIGTPSTPTTPGRFFVWARVGYADVQGPYGNFAVGLSGFSRVITDWPGGGRMAIHGTSDPSVAGEDVSNGCIRVFNPLMAKLIDVPMGTTVIIRP